jgi:hypothetical protein
MGSWNYPCSTFMHATINHLFLGRTLIFTVMAVGYSFVPSLCVDIRRAWQPNSAGYQQHVGALFACLCTCIEDGRSRATGAEKWMVRDELVISLKQTKPLAWGHLEFLTFRDLSTASLFRWSHRRGVAGEDSTSTACRCSPALPCRTFKAADGRRGSAPAASRRCFVRSLMAAGQQGVSAARMASEQQGNGGLRAMVGRVASGSKRLREWNEWSGERGEV